MNLEVEESNPCPLCGGIYDNHSSDCESKETFITNDLRKEVDNMSDDCSPPKRNLTSPEPSSEQAGAICPNCEMNIMSFPCLTCGYRPIPSTESEKGLEELAKTLFEKCYATINDRSTSYDHNFDNCTRWIKQSIFTHTQFLRSQLDVAVKENKVLRSEIESLNQTREISYWVQKKVGYNWIDWQHASDGSNCMDTLSALGILCPNGSFRATRRTIVGTIDHQMI